MDASPNVLAETVRAKRVAIDNDLELLRVRLQEFDPRRMGTVGWAKTALPVALGTAALQFWRMRQHRIRSRERPPVRRTPPLPRAVRRNNGFGMMLVLAAATGALLALADVMQEQR